MSDNDKMLYELDELVEPAKDDALLVSDTSESNEPKKLLIEALMQMILSGNMSFKISDDSGLILLEALDANGKRIHGLAKATDDKDAVRFSQVRHLVDPLEGLEPFLPSVADRGSFLRVVTQTITMPFGGFYLFYWCVDAAENTQLTLDGGSVVASSGATVNFDGSVANVVNIPKTAGMQGKYFHCAVRYRNSSYVSGLSATSHFMISAHAPVDLIVMSSPGEPINQAVSIANNRVVISADKPENVPVGASYRFDILFDGVPDTQIGGNEAQLLTFYSNVPRFVYDIPMMQSGKAYVHVRMSCVSAYGAASSGTTRHVPVSFDDTALNESFLDYMAQKVAEKVQTQDGTPLTAK